MDEEAGWFIVFVIAPSVLATLYYGLFVSDIYVSESRFVIKNPYQKRSQVSSFASLVHITGLSGRQGRAKAARLTLAQYQNSPELIDPAEQAGGAHEISNGLIAQRAALQAQLDQMQRGTLGSPSIPALQNHVNALSVQIGAQDNRVVGSKDSIASKLGCYENLLVRQEFVTENLNTANVALVQSGADTQRQQYNLGRVVEPNFPAISLSPNRVLNIIIVALSAVCLCLIGQILIVGILDHASDE